MKWFVALATVLSLAAAGAGEARAQETRLLRQPTVSERHIAFAW